MVSTTGVHRSKKSKILVIRFSSIGDIVLTSPVLRCMHNQLDTEIHFLTKTSFASLVTSSPYVTKVWILDDMAILIKSLKNEKYDFVIDLHKNLRSKSICLRLGVRKFTYDKTTIEKLLLIYLRINKLPKMHVVDRYMNAVAPLGVINDGVGLDFFFEKNDIHVNGIPATPFVAAVIGATHFTKKLPIDKWMELIGNATYQFVLIGGNAEKETAETIHKKWPEKTVNLVGLTTLQQSAFLLKKAEVVVTNDTGMLHIAAALKKPIVSLWGGTIHEYGFWPYYPTGTDLNTPVEVTDLPCRPCSKFGRNDCPKGHFKCMNDLQMDIALNAIKEKIQTQPDYIVK